MKRSYLAITILGYALFSGFDSIKAENTEAVTSLDSCIAIAMRNNLNVKASALQQQKAKDMESTYFEIEPTEISLSQDPTGGGGPENSITVSQTFSMPSVYTSRRKQLKAQTQVERQKHRIAGKELAMEVTSAYYSVLKQRDVCKLLQEQDSVYSNFLKIADVRYRNGESGALERMNAQKALEENGILLSNAQKEYGNSVAALQSLVGTSRPILPQETKLNAIDGSSALLSFNAESTAADSLSVLEKRVGEREVSCAKKAYLPTVSIALRGQALIKGFNPYNVERERFAKGNFMGFEVGIGLPLSFSAIRGKVKAAQREVELADVNRERQKANLQLAHKQLLSSFATAQQAIQYYEQTGIPQAQEMERLSQVSYANGEINYIELTQNLKEAISVKLDYLEAIDDYNQIVIKLNYLTGKSNN